MGNQSESRPLAIESSAEDAVPPPESEDVEIWRYMDLAKFVSILENKSLFFTRVPLLDDNFEGSFPESQPPISRILEMLPPRMLPANAQVHFSPDLERTWHIVREWAMVSCWHASINESDAMWRLYSESNAAIAIRSSVRRLRSALGSRPPFEPGFGGTDRFHFGMVKYIDFGKDRIPVTSFAAQFFRKRKAFEHERELRVLLMDFPIKADGHLDHSRLPDHAGREFPVDVGALVEEVRVGPKAPTWYVPLVAKLLARYGVPVRPKPSSLGGLPTY